MVIDVHVHPTGYSLISQDPEERKSAIRYSRENTMNPNCPSL